MPLRSTGCYKCRQRKLKCTEERPGCRRCDTHGVVCPGYKTTAGGVEFRDQTSQTVLRLNSVPNDQATAWTLTQPTAGIQARRQTPAPTNALIWDTASEVVKRGRPCQVTHARPAANKAHNRPNGMLRPVRSPAANRMALYDTFMHSYLPNKVLRQERGLWVSHYDYLSMLIAGRNRPPHLSHALDAVGLVQVGSIRQEKRILHAAIQSYTKALRSLALAISSSNSIHDDTVLATATLLSICEFYNEFRLQGQTWIGHQQGMQRLLDARGPESIVESELALHIFYQSTSSSLAMSLLMRKEDFYASARWRGAVARAGQFDDHSESYRLGLRLPGLLERHDSLCSQGLVVLSELDNLLDELADLELEMKEYLVKLHMRSAKTAGSWFDLVDVKQFLPYASLVADRTMTRAFQFPSFTTGYVLTSHWLRMYLLRDAIQSLHKQRQQLVPCWSPDADQIVESRELLTYMLNLCRSVPYFVEPVNSSIGEMCCFFPLFVAEQYFKTHGHWRWTRLVHNMSENLFRKGMSMPFPRDALNNLSPGLMDAGEDQIAFNWIEAPSTPQRPDSLRSYLHRDDVWTHSMRIP